MTGSRASTRPLPATRPHAEEIAVDYKQLIEVKGSQSWKMARPFHQAIYFGEFGFIRRLGTRTRRTLHSSSKDVSALPAFFHSSIEG